MSRQEGEADAHFVDRATRASLAGRTKRADLLDDLESAPRFMSGDEAAETIAQHEADLRRLDGT